jgi:hypothetical protein
VHARPISEKTELGAGELSAFFESARAIVDQSIRANRRDDGLFHSYNLLAFSERKLSIEHLPEMLEGQVATLSSGLLSADESLKVLRALRKSALYRKDAKSYLLYPDRALPRFLEKNVIPENELARSPLLLGMLERKDERLVGRDAAGQVRFAGTCVNAQSLGKQLDLLDVTAERETILQIYESVFHHHAFTGRSGSMFAFEGLGSIYWHMISKLLLAVQECFFRAVDGASSAKTISALAAIYYEIRSGLGFHKTPSEYGAFPTDPYSHTPSHAGAQQPGMTGQVKEELLTRIGELGVRVRDGRMHFEPLLLRKSEFLQQPASFSFVNVNGQHQSMPLPADSLAFTFCRTPIVYELADAASVQVLRGESVAEHPGNVLPEEESRSILQGDGKVGSIRVKVSGAMLLSS